MLGGAPSSRRSRVADRWQGARLVILALVASGFLVALVFRAPDVGLYEHYARAALASPLFHSLPKEYPAASLAIFVIPLVLPVPYLVGFALLAIGGVVALLLCSDGLSAYPDWSLRVCLYLLLSVVAVVFARYDIFPALTAFLAVEGARRGKWGRAWGWAVLGGLLKLFPFLLLPGFLIVERRRTGKWPLKRLWVAIVPLTMVTVAELALSSGSSLISPLRYEVRRGFELSSLPGSLSLLADPFHVHWVWGFGSVEIAGGGHMLIAMFVTVLMGVGMLAIWILGWRDRLSLEAVSLSILTIAVLTDKAFAPQYLIWLIPFWAYWPLRRGWVAAAALTSLVYPFLYTEAHIWGPGFYLATATAGVRNVVLIVPLSAGWSNGLREHRSHPDTLQNSYRQYASPSPERADALAS